MRIATGFSLVLCTVSFILAFLCIYAGSSPGFMDTPNYSIVSLNTSGIGESIIKQVQLQFANDKTKLLSVLNTLLTDIVNGSSNKKRAMLNPEPLQLEDIITERDVPSLSRRELAGLEERGIIQTITGTITGAFKNLTDVNAAFAKAEAVIQQFAQEIGLEDFYMYHVEKYCEGQYTPTDAPNATVSINQIHNNVTDCKPYLHWTPGQTVQLLLNKTGLASVGVTLDTIHWPTDIDTKVQDAENLLNATKWLYVITIIFTALAMVACIIALVHPGRYHVISAGSIVTLALLACFICAIASIILTVAAVEVDKAVRDAPSIIGIQSTRGNGFLGLTWACTGCLLVASILGCFTCCGERRKKRAPKYG